MNQKRVVTAKSSAKWVAVLGLSGVAIAAQFTSLNPAVAQVPPVDAPLPLTPLGSVAVPMPADLDVYIKDKAAAIRLGKALFWDQQAGSEGTACASCHQHGGAACRRTVEVTAAAVVLTAKNTKLHKQKQHISRTRMLSLAAA